MAGSPLEAPLGVVISGPGKNIRLSSEQKWLHAMRVGDLSPETPVTTERGGAVTGPVLARDVPELAALFVREGLLADAPTATPTDPEVEPVAEPTELERPAASAAAAAPAAFASLPLSAPAKLTLRSTAPAKAAPTVSPRGRPSALMISLIVLIVVVVIAWMASRQPTAGPPQPAAATLPVAVEEAPAAAPLAAAPLMDVGLPPSSEPPSSETSAPAPAQPEEEKPSARVAPPEEIREAEVVAKPSFNCAFSRKASEYAICGDPGLARLDVEMAAAFYRRKDFASPDEAADLRLSQARFLLWRDACRDDERCLHDRISARIAELRNP